VSRPYPRRVALENLAPTRLAGKSCVDSPQSLEDRLVLLLEPLEPPVDCVEMPEHLPSQLGEHLGEPEIHRIEPAIDLGELTAEEFDELPTFGGGHVFSLVRRGSGSNVSGWRHPDAAHVPSASPMLESSDGEAGDGS
jgi:hypothetical protein